MSKRRKDEREHGHPDDEERMEVPIESPDPEDAEAQAPVEADEARDLAGRQMQELQERLKRVQAEFLNETKRIQRQADEGRKFAIERVVQDLLPVFDALHSARQGLARQGLAREGLASQELARQGQEPRGTRGAEGTGSDAMREGLDLVEKELMSALARHGVARIEADGSPFDPSVHEALFVVEDERLPPGTVAQVLRPGFSLHGRVVRAAHVAVTTTKDEDEDAAPDPGDGTPDGTADEERS